MSFRVEKNPLKNSLDCFNEAGTRRIMALPTVAIVGRQMLENRLLFNRIAGERISIVEDVERCLHVTAFYTTG